MSSKTSIKFGECLSYLVLSLEKHSKTNTKFGEILYTKYQVWTMSSKTSIKFGTMRSNLVLSLGLTPPYLVPGASGFNRGTAPLSKPYYN